MSSGFAKDLFCRLLQQHSRVRIHLVLSPLAPSSCGGHRRGRCLLLLARGCTRCLHAPVRVHENDKSSEIEIGGPSDRTERSGRALGRARGCEICT